MATLRDIRKRIKSVKNTQKITKAMKMVSAAKLRRSQDRMMSTRPYSEKLSATVAGLARRAHALGEASHPLLVTRPENTRGGRIELLLVTSDRGLCGAFNSNVVRRAARWRFDHRDVHKEVITSTIGKKGFEGAKRDQIPVRKAYEGILSELTYEAAQRVAIELADRYTNGEIDGVQLMYNEFVNAATQRVVVVQLLPLQEPEQKGETVADYEYEPGRAVLLDQLLPRQVAITIYRALLESVASEHAARMSAMDNASRNAKEMVDSLTLNYNRARQAAITKELMEIIGGAEALKG